MPSTSGPRDERALPLERSSSPMKHHLRFAFVVVAALALAGLAAGCGSKKSTSGTTTASSGAGSQVAIVGTYENGSPQKGGTWRVGIEQAFGFTNNFDPTGEYLGTAINIYENLLLRTLVGYKHAPGVEGNLMVGDLATAVPKPTDGGLTY